MDASLEWVSGLMKKLQKESEGFANHFAILPENYRKEITDQLEILQDASQKCTWAIILVYRATKRTSRGALGLRKMAKPTDEFHGAYVVFKRLYKDEDYESEQRDTASTSSEFYSTDIDMSYDLSQTVLPS